MYGSWTEDVILWSNFLGFIWEILNVLLVSVISHCSQTFSVDFLEFIEICEQIHTE